MKLPLSKRLLACCDFIRPGSIIADVGCDHGYLGIHLLLNEIASFVIASDVNEMPLKSGMENAKKYGVSDKVSFYLSDGVDNIPRDFDVMVCAGMGADTMIRIFDSAPWLKDEKYTFILQCQSKRPELRDYLSTQGYVINRETLVKDGRFIYTIMDISYSAPYSLSPGKRYLSNALLESGSPLLSEFIDRLLCNLNDTISGLERSSAESNRIEEYKLAKKEIEEMRNLINVNG